MKAPLENTQELQKETVQHVQQESSTGGEAAMLDNRPAIAVQRKLRSAMGGSDETDNPIQWKNNTGLPDNLKSGIENLSGYSMDDVKVHYNSNKPAQLQAHAYAQGTDIHLAPGQEKHLPHEAWHVVQQKQGRVKPTMQFKGKVNINDDVGLEREADVMGARSIQQSGGTPQNTLKQSSGNEKIVQRLTGYEIETNIPIFGVYNIEDDIFTDLGQNHLTDDIRAYLTGGAVYGPSYGEDREGRFQVSADHNKISFIHNALMVRLIVLGLVKPSKVDGYIDGDMDQPVYSRHHRAMANIEYITPPRKELGLGSLLTHQQDISAVKTHLDDTLAAAQQKQVMPIPDPGRNVFTGIPYNDIINWVKNNGKDESLIQSKLDEMQEAINDQLYVQETSGVLPEDIPAVFDQAEKTILTNGKQKAPIIKELLQNTLATGQEVFEIGMENIEEGEVKESLKKHKGAVVGYLTLLSSYVLAENLSRLTIFANDLGSEKNLLPFLSKTPLSMTLAALPEEVRPQSGVQMKQAWMIFKKMLLEKQAEGMKDFESRDLDTKDKLKLETEEKKIRNVFSKGATEEELENLINGEDVNVLNTGNSLGLDDPVSEVARETGQQGIPLEDRYFNDKYDDSITSANMEERIGERFKFASGLNLDHLKETEREQIENESQQELSNEQKLTSQVERIEKRLENTEIDKSNVLRFKLRFKNLKFLNQIGLRKKLLDSIEKDLYKKSSEQKELDVILINRDKKASKLPMIMIMAMIMVRDDLKSRANSKKLEFIKKFIGIFNHHPLAKKSIKYKSSNPDLFEIIKYYQKFTKAYEKNAKEASTYIEENIQDEEKVCRTIVELNKRVNIYIGFINRKISELDQYQD